MSSKRTSSSPTLDFSSLSSIAKMAVNEPVALGASHIDVTLIDVLPQVRTDFSNLDDLVASIKVNGIKQDLIVHEEGGRFRLIAGERRLRAAIMVGLNVVPAKVEKNLSAIEIRRIQITENKDREDLTPYDETNGVIADVEEHGTKVAMQIWNRSEAWINKRVAVARYALPVKELLQSKACGDFELLHSLNQLHALKDGKEQFDLFYTKLTSGVPVFRDEVRSCVATLKEASNSNSPNKTASSAKTKKTTKRLENLDECGGGTENAPNNNGHNAGASMPTRDDESVNSHESDDALWGAFLNATLPTLINLGAERSARFLAKLNATLAQCSAAELLEHFTGTTTKADNK